MRGLVPVLVVGGVLWLLSQKVDPMTQQQSGDGATKPGNINRSLLALVPAFREKVTTLLERMRARGLRPLVWETYRSPERAARLAGQGTGIALSMHSLGLAVDIVDAVKRWDASPAFWAALGAEATLLGLEWGGNDSWKTVKRPLGDRPHVQAGPATNAWQNRMRAATAAQREDILRRQYA